MLNRLLIVLQGEGRGNGLSYGHALEVRKLRHIVAVVFFNFAGLLQCHIHFGESILPEDGQCHAISGGVF